MPLQARAAEARAGEREDASHQPGRAAQGRDQPAGPRERRLQTQVRETERSERVPRGRIHQRQPVLSRVLHVSVCFLCLRDFALVQITAVLILEE